MPKKVGAGRNLQEYSEKNGEYLEDDFSGGDTQATAGVQVTGNTTSNEEYRQNTPYEQMAKPSLKYQTVQEAENTLQEYAQGVSLKGIKDVETAQVIADTIESVTSKFPLKRKLDTIAINPRLKSTNAWANFKLLEINAKYANGEKKQKSWEERVAEKKSWIEVYEKRLQNPISFKERIAYIEEIKRLKSEIEYKRWSVSGSNDLEATILHEYGHVISDQYIGLANKNLANPNFSYSLDNKLREACVNVEKTYMKALQNGDIKNISLYAAQDKDEFFAEAFAMYALNEPLPNYITETIEGVLKYGTM